MVPDTKAKLLKVEDVAERLNCSISNVYNLVHAGDLRCYRIGRGKGGIRFSDEQVFDFLQRREICGEQSARPLPGPAKVKELRHLRLE